MKKDFEFIEITRNSDSNKFVDLLENAAFIHNRKADDLDWLKWKYFSSPFGDCIVVMAYDQNKQLAGEISFGKYEFVDDGKIVKAIYSYQTMVHPDFQRRGLFTSLTNEVLKIAKSQQVDIVFNFPNHNSYQPFLKMNFKPLNSLKYWVKRGNLGSFLKHFSPLSLKKPFLVNPIKEYDTKTLELFERLAKNIQPYAIKNTLYPNRSFKYLKWRFFTYPMFQYEIIETDLGWAITRVGKRGKLSEAQIMDVFPNKDFDRAFLSSITKEIKNKLKVGLIVFNMTTGHPLNKIMKKNGFFSVPNKLKFCVFPLSEKGNNYLEEENWIITATEFHRY